MIRRLFIVASLGLVCWDALLHTTTLVVGRRSDGLPSTALPWPLFPVFPDWATYDFTWALIHWLAFGTLSLALVRSEPQPQ
jgi:hypothetical protein